MKIFISLYFTRCNFVHTRTKWTKWRGTVWMDDVTISYYEYCVCFNILWLYLFISCMSSKELVGLILSMSNQIISRRVLSFWLKKIGISSLFFSNVTFHMLICIKKFLLMFGWFVMFSRCFMTNQMKEILCYNLALSSS